tara:strand:- start:52 stop:357 length:306 start_codon:yes stop_codon:yes gene_type:complete
MDHLRVSMSSILSSKFRFLIYIVVGYVFIIGCALLTGATMPLIIDNFRYQGRGGYEAGGVLGLQLGIIGVILSVLIIEVLRKKTENKDDVSADTFPPLRSK